MAVPPRRKRLSDDEIARARAFSPNLLLPWVVLILLPLLADVPSIQDVLGCGRSQAYQHAKRLKEKLAQLIGEGEDVRAVGLEVIRLCGAPGLE